MNFKLKSIAFFLVLAVMVGVTSCNDDEETTTPAAPTISSPEIGEDNSMTATVGGELHMDAEIDAPGKIDKITVDLHLESGTGDDIEAEYTEYAGQLNADFHKDLDIPATATPGEYHFHLTVVDQEGQSTSYEVDVEIE